MREEQRQVIDEVFLRVLEEPECSRVAILARLLKAGEIDDHIEAEVRQLIEADQQANDRSWLESPPLTPMCLDDNTRDTASLMPDETSGWNAAACSDLSLGDHVGKYRIEREIGIGGFGRVFAATDKFLKQLVALKVPKAKLQSNEAVEEFYGEAKAIWQLQREAPQPHKNIIQVLNVDSAPDGQPYIAMELVDGQSLDELLAERRKLPWKDAAELMIAVASAMAFAHRNRIVHRDLKPANILLDQANNPKVTDFGLAIRDDQPHRDGEVAGTRAYMAPEQLRGDSLHFQGDTDVWALGVILFQLTTGSLPFRDAKQVASGRPKRLSELEAELPDNLERLCMECLHKEPEKRPTAQQFADRLRETVHQRTVVKSSLRYTSAIIAIVAVGIVMIGFGAAAISNLPHTPGTESNAERESILESPRVVTWLPYSVLDQHEYDPDEECYRFDAFGHAMFEVGNSNAEFVDIKQRFASKRWLGVGGVFWCLNSLPTGDLRCWAVYVGRPSDDLPFELKIGEFEIGPGLGGRMVVTFPDVHWSCELPVPRDNQMLIRVQATSKMVTSIQMDGVNVLENPFIFPKRQWAQMQGAGLGFWGTQGEFSVFDFSVD